MNDQDSVDFLKQKYKLVPGAKEIKRKKKLFKIFGAIFVVTAICGILFSYNLSKQYNDSVSDYGGFSLFSSLRGLVGSSEKTLTGEGDDRINFLLLGVGGSGHDGPELTDTMIFASFKPSTNKIGMLSIPRDLAVPIPGYGYQKINSINAYAEMDSSGSGPEWTSNVVGDLLNQEIHYFVKVDFNGFVDLIDAIGGVDIYVDRSFTDNLYPTEDDLVQTIEFTQGYIHMDGQTALQFSRSRHGNNGEGSDFARAERQQKIILAVKDELLSASTLLNPAKLNDLIETFQNNVETNMSFWELMKMTRYIPDVDTKNITTTVLEDGDGNPLYSTMINGAFVLLPKRDDWEPIKEMAANLVTQTTTDSSASNNSYTASGTETMPLTKIEIQNGTGVTGLAFQTSQMLSGTNFSVTNISNADSQDYETTIIYDLTGGKKTQELQILKEFLEADVAMTSAGWVFSDTVVPRELTVENPSTEDQTVDFLVILGQNATSLVLQ
ncbi:LCP family protein [Patescibacteria group bacterium]|nr:LCP family protein [Patescibacteria group bacterium]MCG2687849.1 LCP family protein [Candidatus Parcubacteria bacterium]